MSALRPPVLVVDDHPVFRAGLAAVLRARGFQEVLEATGDEPLEELLGEFVPGAAFVALVDVGLGARDGVTLCRELLDASPKSVVVMVSSHTEPAVVDSARRAGAFAYLSKEASAGDIIRAVEAGLSGASARIARQEVPSLTARETLVLVHLADGASNKEIAAALGIGVETVKDHLERLYGKLAVTDRLQAVRQAQNLGLLTVADLRRRGR